MSTETSENEQPARCTCGHDEDDHGHDDDFPGSTACQEDGCGCIAFESEG